MAANPRGDVKVTILGEDYLLAPKFKAISAIEVATGKGLLELIGSVAGLHTHVVAVVLFQALRANDFKKLSFDDIGEAVMDSISDPDQPLVKAAVEYLNAFFPKKKEDAPKKPDEVATVTG